MTLPKGNDKPWPHHKVKRLTHDAVFPPFLEWIPPSTQKILQWFFKDIMYQTNGWTKWQILHTSTAYFITAALTAVCSTYTHQGAYVQPPTADDRKHAHFYDNQQHHLDNHITKAQHSPKSETAKFMVVNYVLLISILITLYVYLTVMETSKFGELWTPARQQLWPWSRSKVKGQGHGMVSNERASNKDHACQIWMLYH